MKHLIPTADPGLCLSPSEQDHANVVLWKPGSKARVELNKGAVAALMLMDGRRTVEIIEASALQLGIDLPPYFLEQLLEALLKVGFVHTTDARALPHWLLPETGHVCSGCGRSCEGHRVGPLSRAEVARIDELHPQLATLEPRFSGVRTMVSQRPSEVFLVQRDGRCIFLNDDRRCALHAHFGPEAKPSICRLFPFVRVTTEAGARLGVHTACFNHREHAQRALGSPHLVERLEAALAALPGGALDRDLVQALPLTPVPRPHMEQVVEAQRRELELLTYLGKAEANVCGALSLFDGRTDADCQRLSAVPASAQKVGVRILKRFARQLREERTSMAPLLGAEQGLGASYSSLLGSLKGLGASADPVEVSPEQEASLLETLRRLVFIRETLTFSSEHEALGAICLGWLLALLCAGPRQDFEALQVTWMRAITTDDLHDKLFDTRREARSWLRALSSS